MNLGDILAKHEKGLLVRPVVCRKGCPACAQKRLVEWLEKHKLVSFAILGRYMAISWEDWQALKKASND